MGTSTTARGHYSTAMGYDTSAIGLYSTAMGHGTIASENSSTAMGYGTRATELYSTAMGFYTFASGQVSTAMGSGTEAGGQYSTAMGQGTTASGGDSTTMGQDTTAIGDSSTAMGQDTTAIGGHSTAMGYGTLASGTSSTAMGASTTASGESSTAMGWQTTASGHYSTAMGNHTTAQPYASLAVGQYNIVSSGTQNSWVTTEALFIIGNGTTDTSRSNAMTVLKNGNVGIGTMAPTATLEVNGDVKTGDLTVTAGKGITLGGVNKTEWPSGGGGGISTTEADTRYIMNTTEAKTGTFNISGNGIIGGNVGIGTTDAQATLDVSGTAKVSRILTETKTSSPVNMTISDFGKTIVVDSTSAVTVNLPSVDASNLGAWFTIVKVNSGNVIIHAADSDYIADSSTGGNISNTVSTEIYANITVQLSKADKWAVLGGHGTWTTY